MHGTSSPKPLFPLSQIYPSHNRYCAYLDGGTLDYFRRVMSADVTGSGNHPSLHL